MDTKSIVDISGWLGVIFYVFAYLLLSIGVLKANSYRFHFLNILGAIGLITDSAYHGDQPNLTVNVIWLVIGILAITRRFFFTSSHQS